IMIAVIIASLVLGIPFVWLNSDKEKQHYIAKAVPGTTAWSSRYVRAIGVSPYDPESAEGGYNLTKGEFSIIVYDEEDNLVSGAVVEWKGCGLNATTITDEFDNTGGNAECPKARVVLPIGVREGRIDIKVFKTGMGEYLTYIPVIRSKIAGPQYN
ncbi:MAG: hypothetical protein QW728_06535, partial [Thermoplasmata archaeon]